MGCWCLICASTSDGNLALYTAAEIKDIIGSVQSTSALQVYLDENERAIVAAGGELPATPDEGEVAKRKYVLVQLMKIDDAYQVNRSTDITKSTRIDDYQAEKNRYLLALVDWANVNATC